MNRTCTYVYTVTNLKIEKRRSKEYIEEDQKDRRWSFVPQSCLSIEFSIARFEITFFTKSERETLDPLTHDYCGHSKLVTRSYSVRLVPSLHLTLAKKHSYFSFVYFSFFLWIFFSFPFFSFLFFFHEHRSLFLADESNRCVVAKKKDKFVIETTKRG